MGRNLLIVGAGVYGLVAQEIAESMGCFQLISFVDDCTKETPNGIAVVGTVADLPKLAKSYNEAVVAIGNSKVRERLLDQLKQLDFQIATLISPRAYVSSTAHIEHGCVVEPMAVLHTGVLAECGSIVSAGAVVNHCSRLGKCSHIDCNATVAGYMNVPAYTKVASGSVFLGECMNASELFDVIKFKNIK